VSPRSAKIRPKLHRDEALHPIVDGIDKPPDDVDSRCERAGDNDPRQEPIANASAEAGAFEADGWTVTLRRRGLSWRHLLAPWHRTRLSGPARRGEKIYGVSKIRLGRKYLHICAFLETFCLIVRDIAFGVSYDFFLSRSRPKP
jgi:hypothetical protein